MTAKAVGGKNIPPPPEATIGQVLAIVPFRFGDKNAPEGTFTCKSGRDMGGPRRKYRGNLPGPCFYEVANVSIPAQTCFSPFRQRGRRHKTAPYVLLPLRPRFIWCKQVYRRLLIKHTWSQIRSTFSHPPFLCGADEARARETRAWGLRPFRDIHVTPRRLWRLPPRGAGPLAIERVT